MSPEKSEYFLSSLVISKITEKVFSEMSEKNIFVVLLLPDL